MIFAVTRSYVHLSPRAVNADGYLIRGADFSLTSTCPMNNPVRYESPWGVLLGRNTPGLYELPQGLVFTAQMAGKICLRTHNGFCIQVA